ncbi:hypothetical protein O159_21540 [Leifsonia xyli subsp. cynodontis DSM 46306]|jgi:hypothetical protein|uniref:Uncharacterized protein n=1 Tax=Leifsonia xyli subsp. cynodontis DSM 46306 TaxID=1389489 RepID=U3PET0_LEIXC|nr:hypothetical protein [Leifsonia xyli]AGW42133.1 hypothetical protein O159_21540 [Leifsonia xyli subsp. cynodontis DSM 46306]
MTDLPLPSVLSAAAPITAWTLTLLLAIASLCCIIATLRRPRRPLVYTGAGLLALAFLALTLPPYEAPNGYRALIGIVALALSVVGGGPAAQLVLALGTRPAPLGANGGIVVHDRVSGPESTREVLRGGTIIGLLERFAATGAIMAGFPEALAVLIAIKGVGRFTELETPETRERFLIGTLVSLVWACVCAGLFRFTAG